MNRFKVYLLIFVFILISTVNIPVVRAETDKIAYVDLSRLFDAYQKTIDYDKKLEAEQNTKEQERNKKTSEIKDLQSKLNLLNANEKDKQQKLIDAKTKELQDLDTQLQMSFRKDRDEKIKEILKDIESAVRDFAKSNNYTFILNDRVLIYGDQTKDITDKVLGILNKDYKR